MQPIPCPAYYYKASVTGPNFYWEDRGRGGFGIYVDCASGIHAYRNIAYNNAHIGYSMYGYWRRGERSDNPWSTHPQAPLPESLRRLIDEFGVGEPSARRLWLPITCRTTAHR